MAVMLEYARFAIVADLKHLVNGVVKALSYCLSEVIAGGYVNVLERMQYRASTFVYPES